jgi:F420H(2)-dependent quinone reductase
VRLLRRYFERAPGWVLVTTRGRKTGLPREVLLPCERSADAIVVISTYGWRSNWIRNMRKDPIAWLRRWVTPRPVVVIRRAPATGPQPSMP